MARNEIMGFRDLTYSAWHRPDSIRRYTQTAMQAEELCMIDIDCVEYEAGSNRPVALIETARYTGRYKTFTVTRKVAERAGLPAFAVQYIPHTGHPNPAAPPQPEMESCLLDDICLFLVQYPDGTCVEYTPEQYARFLLKLRGLRL